jgi:hypothetical protein
MLVVEPILLTLEAYSDKDKECFEIEISITSMKQRNGKSIYEKLFSKIFFTPHSYYFCTFAIGSNLLAVYYLSLVRGRKLSRTTRASTLLT